MSDSSHADEVAESVADLQRRAQEVRSPHQRWIEQVTRQIGRPRTVYVIVAMAAGWIAYNLVTAGAGRPPIDPPPFYALQGVVSFTALVMTVFILTTENRQARHQALREQLDLQINMLTERKVAKLIQMVDELRRDMPQVPTVHDPEVVEMGQRTDPGEAVRALEELTESPLPEHTP